MNETDITIPPLSRLIEQFLNYQKTLRGGLVNTIESYRRDLTCFADFLTQKGWQNIALTRSQCRMFIACRSSMGQSAATINRLLSALRSFYRYLMLCQYVDDNPFATIRGLKKEKKVPLFLFKSEMIRLLEETQHPQHNEITSESSLFGRCRDTLLIELLYACGCRVSEACSIDLPDVDSERRQIRVVGKGNKERLLYFGAEFAAALAVYLPARAALRQKSGAVDAGEPLLLNQRGGRLTRRGINLILKKRSQAAGLDKPLSAHTFRHTFATHLVQNGADIRLVQELLGHASLAATQIYTHMDVARLQRLYYNAHPHAKRRN